MHVVGVDESNFSPSLCGDCVVCALVRTGEKIEGVKSSKQLSPKKRLELFAQLQKHSLYYVVPAVPNTISKVNTYLARNVAISMAIQGLMATLVVSEEYNGKSLPQKVLIDGSWSSEWLEIFGSTGGRAAEGVIRGDETVYEIGAASIIAKCYCDSLLGGWDLLYPNWGIGCDHGSISSKHLEELRARGPSPVHRVGKYAPAWWKRVLEKELR